MALHFYCNDKDEWEIRDENSGELLASFECDDDSIEFVEQVITDLEKERDALIERGNKMLNALISANTALGRDEYEIRKYVHGMVKSTLLELGGESWRKFKDEDDGENAQ